MKRILKTTAIAFIMILVSATVTNVTAQYYENDAQYNNNGQQYYDNDRDVSYQQFYDELSPYGQWVDYPGQGYVWVPDAESDFRPYSTNGHWVWTEDYEWMWVSDYDWGWAPFHYGRWDNDPYYGWYWVPGYEWSPAWVAWRDGGDYYGWAPIRPGINININFNIGSYSPPYDFWCFAPRRYISSPYINRYYVDPRQNVTIINQTNIIINNYRYGGNYGFRSGPRRMEVERYTGRINPVRFQQSYRPGRTSFRGNVISVYRPNVRQDNNRNFAPRQVQQYERREGSFRRNSTGNNGRNNNMNNRGNNLPDRRDIGRRDNAINNRGNNLPDRRVIDRSNNNGQGRTIDGRINRNNPGNDPRNDNRRFDRNTERNINQNNLPERQPDNRRVMNERPQRTPPQMEQRTTQPRQQRQQQMERRQPQREERSQPPQQMDRRTTETRQQPQRQMESGQPQRVERSQPTRQPRQVDRTNDRPGPSNERNGNNSQSGKRRKF